MPVSLRTTLESLANDFASRLLRQVVSNHGVGSLAALLVGLRAGDARGNVGAVGSRAGKLPRARRTKRRVRKAGTRSKVEAMPGSESYGGTRMNRGNAAIHADVDRLVAFLVQAGQPLRSKPLRTALGLTKDRFLRTVHRALDAGRVRALGDLAQHGYEAV